MKKATVLLLFLFVTIGIFAAEMQVKTLPNGMTVVIKQNTQNPTVWRATLLSIHAKSLKIVNKRTMDKIMRIRSITNPAMGLSAVEFSRAEIAGFRRENLHARKAKSQLQNGEEQ